MVCSPLLIVFCDLEITSRVNSNPSSAILATACSFRCPRTGLKKRKLDTKTTKKFLTELRVFNTSTIHIQFCILITIIFLYDKGTDFLKVSFLFIHYLFLRIRSRMLVKNKEKEHSVQQSKLPFLPWEGQQHSSQSQLLAHYIHSSRNGASAPRKRGHTGTIE